jgi:DNA-binding MarR family transcriptional regulator
MLSPTPKPDRRGSRGFDSAEQEAFLNLWRTYDRLKALEDELFGKFELSAQQYNSLRILRSAHPDPMPTLALAQRLISRAPDITRMLDKLQRRRLIERERKADNRRVVEVKITQAGIDLLRQMADAVQEMHARQLGHLNAAELKELVRLLKRARDPHEDATCDWLDED